MAKNVGPEDRVVRIVAAIGLGVMLYFKVLEGTEAIVTAVIAGYLLLSGLFARDVFYKMLDIDTTIQEQSYSTTDDRSGL